MMKLSILRLRAKDVGEKTAEFWEALSVKGPEASALALLVARTPK